MGGGTYRARLHTCTCILESGFVFQWTCCLLKGAAASVRTGKVLNQHASRAPELPLCVFSAARITFVEAVFNPGEVFTTFTVRFFLNPPTSFPIFRSDRSRSSGQPPHFTVKDPLQTSFFTHFKHCTFQ